MKKAFTLRAYRLILRIHPPCFVERFGDEMLWIFEEERQRGATLRLLFDGILSVVRQRLNPGNEFTHNPTSSVLLISDLKIARVRLLQGALASSLLFSGFVLAIDRGGPLPVPFELQTQRCIPCSGRPPAYPLDQEARRNPLQ
jgi:hypothetical protein